MNVLCSSLGLCFIETRIKVWGTATVDNYDPRYYKVKHLFKSQNLNEPDERLHLIDRDSFDPLASTGLTFQSSYRQSRYDRQSGSWYQIKVHYYVYRDKENNDA